MESSIIQLEISPNAYGVLQSSYSIGELSNSIKELLLFRELSN